MYSLRIGQPNGANLPPGSVWKMPHGMKPEKYMDHLMSTDVQTAITLFNSGIISKKAQARYFGRPNAHEGSIISAWMKKHKHGGGNVNGISWYVARHFVGPRCKPLRLKVWARRKNTRRLVGRQLVLWVELNKHLKSASPLWIKQCIREMAAYQRWIFGVQDVKLKVNRMINEREICQTN